MGEGMGGCLINDGIAGTADTPLIVWNRTKNKALDFQKQYSDKNIVVLDTAKEVVERCGVVYSMLSTPEASKIVFEATDGVLAGVHEKTSLVDCATLAERDMQRMNSAVVAKGGRFLEAPVSGSKVPAAKGLLIFLCSGNKDLFDEIKDTGLKSMGKASHFFGDSVGGGTRAKLVVNSLMGTMLAAFGEGLALAESVGLNADTMMEVISQGAITSPVYSLKGPKMVAKDHAPNFPLKHATKVRNQYVLHLSYCIFSFCHTCIHDAFLKQRFLITASLGHDACQTNGRSSGCRVFRNEQCGETLGGCSR